MEFDGSALLGVLLALACFTGASWDIVGRSVKCAAGSEERR